MKQQIEKQYINKDLLRHYKNYIPRSQENKRIVNQFINYRTLYFSRYCFFRLRCHNRFELVLAILEVLKDCIETITDYGLNGFILKTTLVNVLSERLETKVPEGKVGALIFLGTPILWHIKNDKTVYIGTSRIPVIVIRIKITPLGYYIYNKYVEALSKNV